MSVKRKYKSVIKKFVELDTSNFNSKIIDNIVGETKEMLYSKLSKISMFCENYQILINGNKITIEYEDCTRDLSNILKGFDNEICSISNKKVTIKDQLLDFLILLNQKVDSLGDLKIINNIDYSSFDSCDLSDDVFDLFNNNFIYKLINNKRVLVDYTEVIEIEKEEWLGQTKELSRKTLSEKTDRKDFDDAVEIFYSKYDAFKAKFKRNMKNGLAECIIAKAHKNNITNVVKKEVNGVIYLTLES